MKFWVKIISVFVITALLIFVAGYHVGAASSKEAGSVNDPIVTKSYVDKQLGSTTYKEVSMEKGQTLIASVGSDFILSSGGGKSEGALISITTGKKLGSGKALSLYRDYVIMNKDTGFKASKATKVLVKGSYTIQ